MKHKLSVLIYEGHPHWTSKGQRAVKFWGKKAFTLLWLKHTHRHHWLGMAESIYWRINLRYKKLNYRCEATKRAQQGAAYFWGEAINEREIDSETNSKAPRN